MFFGLATTKIKHFIALSAISWLYSLKIIFLTIYIN